MIKSDEQLNYEIELMINDILYKKKIISKNSYIRVRDELLKLVEICKHKN